MWSPFVVLLIFCHHHFAFPCLGPPPCTPLDFQVVAFPELLKGLLSSMSVLASFSAFLYERNVKVLANISRRFLVLVYVGELSMSIHSSTLRLCQGRGRDVPWMFTRQRLCVVFTFFLSCTDPPVIAKMLGKYFGIREL